MSSRRTFARCAPVNSGLGTWSIQSGTAPRYSVMDLTVWSQPLTFGGRGWSGEIANRVKAAPPLRPLQGWEEELATGRDVQARWDCGHTGWDQWDGWPHPPLQ